MTRDSTSREDGLEGLAARARSGNREALDELARRVQDPIYGLALRMLWHPEDARDATQEILIRVVTRLSTFRGESAFLTWVYRVAANHLLTFRKSRLEREGYDFERFGRELEQGLSDAPLPPAAAEQALLLEEVKIGCTLGMLLCLDRPHRLAYILGEILEVEGAEAARVLRISHAAFRKRLSRAREEILQFTRARCGLLEPRNACRCRRRVRFALESGRLDPKRLLFASDPDAARGFPAVLVQIRKLEEIRRAAALYRSQPETPAPAEVSRWLRRALASR
jgi:RNA polymerase sigma factor (sigma-70 family)